MGWPNAPSSIILGEEERRMAPESGRTTRTFTLILGGGGARGFAHAGVLHALERRGWAPSAIVGVSMGAVVAAAYALRTDWYRAVMDFADEGFSRRRRLLGDEGPARARR